MKEHGVYKFCPTCAQPLVYKMDQGIARWRCETVDCGFVLWENPTPVVAAIVEHESKVLLVRNIGWPESWFGLVTGFLEKNEDPAEAVLREVKEETGLDGTVASFIGHYPFHYLNQLIITYHVQVQQHEVTLDRTELADFRWVPVDQVQPWDRGTGIALRDWLRTQGYERELIPLFRPPRNE